MQNGKRQGLFILIFLFIFSLPTLNAHSEGELIEAAPEESSQTGTKEFISGLVDRATGENTGPDERDELLLTASEFARTYSDMTGDRDFERKIERRINSTELSAYPITPEPAVDLSDIEEYELIMQARAQAHGVRALVEDFITGLIDKALKKDIPVTEKSALLRTAMKFAR
ncbi:MAG: hypothetical protein V3T30_08935, partial [Thermodesulfobacteriota bacterium]